MIVRIAFGLILIAATALLLTPLARFLVRPDAVKWLLKLLVASRIAGWLLTYVVLGDLARYSDLSLYYYPEAESALKGLVPYVDFPTSYGPFFSYLSALMMPIWHSRAALAVVLVALEIGAVLMFVRVAKSSSTFPPETLARCLYIYLCNPAAFYWSGMLAYNSSVVLFFWVWSVALLVRGRYAQSLVAEAASVLVGKFLGVLVGPVWLGCARHSYRTLIAFACAGVAVLLALRSAGIDLLLPLQREGGRVTSGNIWFLLTGVVAVSPESTVWQLLPLVVLGLSLASLGVWLYVRWRQPPSFEEIAAAVAACGWLFMLLSRKSYPHYTPMFLLFFSFVMATHNRYALGAVALAVVGAVGIIEPGVWNALGQPSMLSRVDLSNQLPLVGALVIFDVVLIAGAALALLFSIQFLLRPHTPSHVHNEPSRQLS